MVFVRFDFFSGGGRGQHTFGHIYPALLRVAACLLTSENDGKLTTACLLGDVLDNYDHKTGVYSWTCDILVLDHVYQWIDPSRLWITSHSCQLVSLPHIQQ